MVLNVVLPWTLRNAMIDQQGLQMDLGVLLAWHKGEGRGHSIMHNMIELNLLATNKLCLPDYQCADSVKPRAIR